MQYITYYIGVNVHFSKKCNSKPISLYTITTSMYANMYFLKENA